MFEKVAVSLECGVCCAIILFAVVKVVLSLEYGACCGVTPLPREVFFDGFFRRVFLVVLAQRRYAEDTRAGLSVF